VIDNRPFHYAIIASIGLHALALLLFPDLLDASRRGVQFPPPIIARLMEPEPAPPPVVPVEKPVITKKAEAAKPVPRVSKPVPQVEAPITQGTMPQETIPEPAPVTPPAVAMQPLPPPAVPSAEVPESLSRDQYRLELIDEARRYKRYPPLARENNWQGDVLVAVVVGANGRASVTLKGSSGYAVLDRQALEMFRQATRAVTVPPALRGKEFALDVRAVYGLED
jgi:TonB family protein